MKRIICILLALGMIIALSGCAKKEPVENESTSQEVQKEAASEPESVDVATDLEKTLISTDWISPGLWDEGGWQYSCKDIIFSTADGVEYNAPYEFISFNGKGTCTQYGVGNKDKAQTFSYEVVDENTLIWNGWTYSVSVEKSNQNGFDLLSFDMDTDNEEYPYIETFYSVENLKCDAWRCEKGFPASIDYSAKTVSEGEAKEIASNLIKKYSQYENFGICCDEEFLCYGSEFKEYPEFSMLSEDEQKLFIEKNDMLGTDIYVSKCCSSIGELENHILKYIEKPLVNADNRDFLYEVNGKLIIQRAIGVGILEYGMDPDDIVIYYADNNVIIAQDVLYNSGGQQETIMVFYLTKRGSDYVVTSVKDYSEE